MTETEWLKDENIELRILCKELKQQIEELKQQIIYEKAVSKIQGKISELEKLQEEYDEKNIIITIKGRLLGHKESLEEFRKYERVR